jgi:hypothetical protein
VRKAKTYLFTVFVLVLTLLSQVSEPVLDPNFDAAVDEAALATPRIAVSHVRNTSSGTTPASGNPHPFERVKDGRHWLMGHNGTIDKDVLYDPDHPNDGLIRPDYFAANPPQLWKQSVRVD